MTDPVKVTEGVDDLASVIGARFAEIDLLREPLNRIADVLANWPQSAVVAGDQIQSAATAVTVTQQTDDSQQRYLAEQLAKLQLTAAIQTAEYQHAIID